MKVIDLFSGCGGLSLGFENSGYEILLALDNLPVAVEIYNKNHNHECREHDLSDVDLTVSMIKEYDYDMIIGGPPCQDFSSAGPRNPNGKRANLTYSFMVHGLHIVLWVPHGVLDYCSLVWVFL